MAELALLIGLKPRRVYLLTDQSLPLSLFLFSGVFSFNCIAESCSENSNIMNWFRLSSTVAAGKFLGLFSVLHAGC